MCSWPKSPMPIIWCVCVCVQASGLPIHHMLRCVYTPRSVWVWSNNGLMIRERRIGAIFTLCT